MMNRRSGGTEGAEVDAGGGDEGGGGEGAEVVEVQAGEAWRRSWRVARRGSAS